MSPFPVLCKAHDCFPNLSKSARHTLVWTRSPPSQLVVFILANEEQAPAVPAVPLADQIRLHLFQPHQADQMFDPQRTGSISCKQALIDLATPIRSSCHMPAGIEVEAFRGMACSCLRAACRAPAPMRLPCAPEWKTQYADLVEYKERIFKEHFPSTQ